MIQELNFMEESAQLLEQVIQDTDARIRASDAELDPFQNSNCKWFETSYQTVQAVESMTKIIDEQENTLTQGQIEKKDEIIAQADAQNDEY